MNKLLLGDCKDKLKELADNSVDEIVTDPPYGYSFMGKDWDKAVPSVDVWKECVRVLKPGGFAFVMSAPRQDVLSQMIVRLSEAGFDTGYSSIYWTYKSGFPKGFNISKAVDARIMTGKSGPSAIHANELGNPTATIEVSELPNNGILGEKKEMERASGGEPQTEEGKKLKGAFAGFQPKPAVEVIIVAMKPLEEKNYVEQALKDGKGVTYLDDVRIPADDLPGKWSGNSASGSGVLGWNTSDEKVEYAGGPHAGGRFPANLLVSDDVLAEDSKYFSLDKWADKFPFLVVPKAGKKEKSGMDIANTDKYDGKFPDSKADKDFNKHPTVKPLKLMLYLITMGSREGDVVLDPFMGSGTTPVAAKMLKRGYVGVEMTEEYYKMAEERLKLTDEITKD